jgi:CheY-like chemotaxis protein
MNPDKPQILIVDDEKQNLLILQEILEDLDCELASASDGEAALSALQAEPSRFDVVVLDRMMPGMDGIECLKRIRAHPVLSMIPVIMQTAAASKEDMLTGIQAGAYYYLTKPFEAPVLLGMVRTALDDRRRFRALQAQIARHAGIVTHLRSGLFSVRTPDEAEALAANLSHLGGNPAMLAIGISELLWNAIEHGNLGITYKEKAELVRAGRWANEVVQRLETAEYRGRRVEVYVERDEQQVRIAVKDQGAGFDWTPYLELDLARAFDVNGRGIAMANSMCFDRLEYLGCGNEVVGTVRVSARSV